MKASFIETLRAISIQTHTLSKGLLSGMYLAAFRGKGLEFEEVRPYVSGDDVRSIDWRATAKMNHPYVKVFREERELKVMLIVDVSASSLFGSKQGTKRETQAEIGAILAYSAIKNHDKVGLLLFSDRVEKYIPPKSGIRHVLRIIFELLYAKGGKKTDIKGALAHFGKLTMKDTICFVLSDFLASGFSNEVKILSLKHDLIGVSVQDPLDLVLPNLGLARLRDLETEEEMVIDTGDKELQNQYQTFAAKRKEAAKKAFIAQGAGWIEVTVGAQIAPILRKFFKLRAKKRR